MKRHVRDNYYIVDEGIYEFDKDGKPCITPPSDAADLRKFRFSRIGPKGPPMDLGVRGILALAMVEGNNQADSSSPAVPAGYTYLGQLIDHDLTFDKTAAAFGQAVTLDELVQGRSPALDLDCVYGRGPGNPDDAKFYVDGVRLRHGVSKASPQPVADPVTITDIDGGDLPRAGSGSTPAERMKAVIPDPRNDENLVVAQTHLTFIHFHNRVVDRLASSQLAGAALFKAARDSVVKHYQWMLRHDYLPRIVDPAVVDDVFRSGRKVFEPYVRDGDFPTMPIEFSVAAFRLGHSMVRDQYQWNRVFRAGGVAPGTLPLLFQFSGTSGAMLPGFDRLPTNWIADFRRLFDFSGFGDPALVVPGSELNLAKKIDTLLVNPLKDLPAGSFGGGERGADIERNLAFRNLTRADMVNLATGPQMVELFKKTVPGLKALTPEQILGGDGGVRLANIPADKKAAIANDTPLWFYILREAEVNGGRLTGVGGRIVAEVFHRAMEGSSASIVRDPTWLPSLGRTAGAFDMPDLIFQAYGGAARVGLLG